MGRAARGSVFFEGGRWKARLTLPNGQRRSVALPIVHAQRVWVPRERLLGRAILALAAGPLTAPQLAARCGVDLEELEDVAGLLRPHAEALRIGDELLAYLRIESASVVFEARARLLAREEVCRVAA